MYDRYFVLKPCREGLTVVQHFPQNFLSFSITRAFVLSLSSNLTGPECSFGLILIRCYESQLFFTSFVTSDYDSDKDQLKFEYYHHKRKVEAHNNGYLAAGKNGFLCNTQYKLQKPKTSLPFLEYRYPSSRSLISRIPFLMIFFLLLLYFIA